MMTTETANAEFPGLGQCFQDRPPCGKWLSGIFPIEDLWSLTIPGMLKDEFYSSIQHFSEIPAFIRAGERDGGCFIQAAFYCEGISQAFNLGIAFERYGSNLDCDISAIKDGWFVCWTKRSFYIE